MGQYSNDSFEMKQNEAQSMPRVRKYIDKIPIHLAQPKLLCYYI